MDDKTRRLWLRTGSELLDQNRWGNSLKPLNPKSSTVRNGSILMTKMLDISGEHLNIFWPIWNWWRIRYFKKGLLFWPYVFSWIFAKDRPQTTALGKKHRVVQDLSGWHVEKKNQNHLLNSEFLRSSRANGLIKTTWCDLESQEKPKHLGLDLRLVWTAGIFLQVSQLLPAAPPLLSTNK